MVFSREQTQPNCHGPHEKMVTCPTGCSSHVTLSKDVSAIKIFLQRLVERAVCPVASSFYAITFQSEVVQLGTRQSGLGLAHSLLHAKQSGFNSNSNIHLWS